MGRAYGVGTVIANLEKWHLAKIAEVTALGRSSFKPMLEGYAKGNARWTDRTGAARRGLTAQTTVTSKAIVVSLMHTVDYGVFLELCNSGRYAILLETMEVCSPRMHAELQAVMRS